MKGKKGKKKVIKKSKKTTKKSPKKVRGKKPKKRVQKKSQEVVVRVQALPPPITPAVLDPIKEKSKYMIPRTWMAERQVFTMLQKTPKEHIKSRPAKGGGDWDYVTGVYVKKVLNFVFGWNWDFEIISSETVGLEKGKDVGQVIVLGKLTVRGKTEHEKIIKTQYGRADIKYWKGTKNPLDLGNSHKTAATDALKKCASELGIASDVYGKNEFKDLGAPVQEEPPKQKAPQKSSEEFKDYVPCQNKCGAVVSPEVAAYSKKIFRGRAYCGDCQKLKQK